MHDLTIYGLERLEDRLLLAVNITQNGGHLIITGDGNDEIIHVHDDGGNGYDEIDVYDATFLAGLKIKHFELIV
jgi:hypothetical protein